MRSKKKKLYVKCVTKKCGFTTTDWKIKTPDWNTTVKEIVSTYQMDTIQQFTFIHDFIYVWSSENAEWQPFGKTKAVRIDHYTTDSL